MMVLIVPLAAFTAWKGASLASSITMVFCGLAFWGSPITLSERPLFLAPLLISGIAFAIFNNQRGRKYEIQQFAAADRQPVTRAADG